MEHDFRIENCLVYGVPEYKNALSTVRCEVCGCAIYDGESYYDFYGESVCEDCEYDYAVKNFRRFMCQ